jgi:hypothetical protein
MSRGALAGWCLACLAALSTPASARETTPESLAQRDATLIADAVAALPAQRPGVIDLYALSFAGDGTEDVFRNEALYFPGLATRRLGARGALALSNHLDSVASPGTPLATYENLQLALDGLAGRMDPDEDMLLLYLTMHGTPEHELVIHFPPFVEDALIAEDLTTLLDEAGIRHRVLVISACYSGGFVRPLRTPDTLLITAARADRASFGCGSDSTVTWFGRAWMVEGLNHETDFASAYTYATQRVRAWEKLEQFKASQPQLSMGKRLRERLRTWKQQTTWGEAVPYPHPITEPGASASTRQR